MLKPLAAALVVVASAATSAAHAASSSPDCVVLDQALREARTEFASLARKGFGGASCHYQKHEFKCAWVFSTDKYGEAETQVERLNRCTAAQPGAEPLPAKRRESAFQINSETAVFIRGPEPESGLWKIQLKIRTTADWE